MHRFPKLLSAFVLFVALLIGLFAHPAQGQTTFETSTVQQTLSRRSMNFDTGVRPVGPTYDLPAMADGWVLGTIVLPRPAVVQLHVGFWEDLLVENLSDTECATWTHVTGAYFSVADVFLGTCNAFSGPALAASDGIPDMPDTYDGTCMDWEPGEDCLIAPVEIPDVFASFTVTLPAGTWQIRSGTYATMTNWNGVEAPPYVGHAPWRALTMNTRARLWGSVVAFQ